MSAEEVRTYIEYGVLGCIALFSIGYVWWNTKNTNEILKKKDEYIEKLNDRREETAGKYRESVTELTAQLTTLVNLLDRRSRE